MSARGALLAGILAASYATVVGEPLVPQACPGAAAAAAGPAITAAR